MKRFKGSGHKERSYMYMYHTHGKPKTVSTMLMFIVLYGN